jgi:hypothetical protein
MAKIDTKEYKDIKAGLVTEGAVGEQQMPLDAVTESLNFDFDKIGCARLRRGTTLLGNQLSGNLLGLYEFRDSGSGSNNQILAVNGTTVYYLNAGTWTSKRTVTTGLKARFSTFLDYVFMVNGTDATAIWNGDVGSSFITSGNASGAPTGKFIDNFRARMWIAGNSAFPDRLYYSSIPTAAATPVITWDTSATTGDWIDISPSDGENITGIKRSKTALNVYKNNHIYRVASINTTDPDPVINVGTYSQESIVEAKDGQYFHHPSGFYRMSGAEATEISRPIQDIVDNISASNYTSICGWEDGDHIYWSVGDVTISGITYSNLVVRYTISSQAWTHRTYPTEFLVSSRYNDGSTLFRLVGDNDGNVLKVNVGKTDNGTPISYALTHRWYTIDGLLSTRKNLPRLVFAHSGGAGTNVAYQIEGDPVSDWSKTLGQFKNVDTLFSKADIRGRKCRFRISGISSGEPFDYYGMEVINATSEPIQF